MRHTTSLDELAGVSVQIRTALDLYPDADEGQRGAAAYRVLMEYQRALQVQLRARRRPALVDEVAWPVSAGRELSQQQLHILARLVAQVGQLESMLDRRSDVRRAA